MAAISLGRVCLNRRRRISSVLLRLGCCPGCSTLIRMDQPNRRWMMWLLPTIRSGCIWWLGFWGNRSSGLEDISRSFEAERVRRLGVFDERKGYVLFDHPSTVSFLRHNARMSGTRANLLVSMARMARKFRSTYLSWKHGQISTDQAHQLFRAAEQMENPRSSTSVARRGSSPPP